MIQEKYFQSSAIAEAVSCCLNLLVEFSNYIFQLKTIIILCIRCMIAYTPLKPVFNEEEWHTQNLYNTLRIVRAKMKMFVVIYLLHFLNCMIGIYRCKVHRQFPDRGLVCMNAARCTDCSIGGMVLYMHTHTWTKSCYHKASRAYSDPPVPGNRAAHATRNKSGLEHLWRLFNKLNKTINV